MTIDVTDPVTGQTASANKHFIKVAPPVDSITPEEEQRILDIIAYVARPEEFATFERLNPVGKMNFWHRFWKDRDPTPGTPDNEFKNAHMARMNYANERFSVGFQKRSDGWRTDMGRIYIVYGPPDNVERYPFTNERPAAEIWFYDHLTGQGQVYCLFVDEGGYGDYNMVHSTARGERRDPTWEAKINDGSFDRTQ
jgi:GWxTD domain-containing protein